MMKSIRLATQWPRSIQNKRTTLTHVPPAVTGGGNRVFTQGSGIGTDSSMIAANHRCKAHYYPVQGFSTATSVNNNDCSLIRRQTIPSVPNRFFSTDKSGMDDEYGEMTNDGHTYEHPTDFELESGVKLPNAQIRYMTYGTLNEARNNVLVICHALTGNASLHSWWGDMLGPGLAFDTDKYFVVCSNIVGSCYGSTGPGSKKPGVDELYGIDFPDISVRDTVCLQLHMLRNDLKIKSVKCVIGGSFGGMQTLEYAVQAGSIKSPFSVDDEEGRATPFVRSVMPIACGAKHTAWQIAISEIQRQAIYADPKWNDGKPSMDDPPLSGLSVARQIGMVSYRTPQGYEEKFSRNLRSGSPPYGSKAAWEVKSYLQYQGFKFLSRFDPITYVKLTEQMDTHDIGRDRGGAKAALSGIHTPAMVLGIDSDVLYPLYEQEELAELFPNGELNIIKSDAGHDGFLLEQDQVAENIIKFLNLHD
jgi:homoserine O-acetyltransferase